MAAGFQDPVCERHPGAGWRVPRGARHVWEAQRFDADTYDGFHLYDLDFTWRASGAGARLAVRARPAAPPHVDRPLRCRLASLCAALRRAGGTRSARAALPRPIAGAPRHAGANRRAARCAAAFPLRRRARALSERGDGRGLAHAIAADVSPVLPRLRHIRHTVECPGSVRAGRDDLRSITGICRIQRRLLLARSRNCLHHCDGTCGIRVNRSHSHSLLLLKRRRIRLAIRAKKRPDSARNVTLRGSCFL